MKDPLGRMQHDSDACMYCGLVHGTVCPRVARVEFDEDGDVVGVDLHQPYPFSVERSDGDAHETISGTLDEVKKCEREKLQ